MAMLLSRGLQAKLRLESMWKIRSREHGDQYISKGSKRLRYMRMVSLSARKSSSPIRRELRLRIRDKNKHDYNFYQI